MKNTLFVLLTTIVALIACGSDPASESGQPDERPTPQSVEEATAQQADKQERQKALQDEGLCIPEAIRAAPEPDERFWHCRGEDWNGSRTLAETLERLRRTPQVYRDHCNPEFGQVSLTVMYDRVICEGAPYEK